jgi:hypothetical protein
MKKMIILLLLTVLSGCAKNAFVGTVNHRFHEKGDHVIWLQVAGLSPEHIAMLKFPVFNGDTGKKQISFERNVCTGSLWNYNLYSLRPKARQGFLSQILGSKNIKGSCQDLDRDPVWKYFEKVGYVSGLFESKKSSKGLSYINDCTDKTKFFEGLKIWKRDKAPQGALTFHYQDKLEDKRANVLFDRSCDEDKCSVPFETHVLKVWNDFSTTNRRTFFVVRDFVYEELILQKKYITAKERLLSIEKIYDYFLKLSKKKKITLVLSSSSELKLDFPRMGRDWSKFEKSGRGINYKSRALLSNVWASGLGSENFCGTYEESEILKRFIWAPDQNITDRFNF